MKMVNEYKIWFWTADWHNSRQNTIIISLLLIIIANSAVSMAKVKWPVSRRDGVAGTATHLPCLAAQTHPGNQAVLVVWYKDGARRPFYILDVREGEGRQERVDTSVKDRLSSHPSGTRLTFDPAQGEDSGSYKCRVDFRAAPTKSSVVTLNIYVIPSRIVVLDVHNRPLPVGGAIRPLTEGDSLTLYCIASGGRPPPEVTWWFGEHMISSHSETVGHGKIPTSPEEQDVMLSLGVGLHYVRATLHIPALTRDFVRANITCRASNNNITEPLSTSVLLEVYTRPSSVSIKPPREPLVEGRKARVECVTRGAYPSAVIIWEKTQEGTTTELKAASVRLGDMTSSRLSLEPEYRDHGAILTCRANNPHIPAHSATTSTVLQIIFAPRVTLKRGYSQIQRPVTEGEDVFFECGAASNPPPHTITWFKDDTQVIADQSAGVLISGNNLVLQMVQHTSAGNYTCQATNTLATSTSNILPLHIKYLPVCVDEPQTVVVAEGEDVRLTCRVDAKPEEDLRFTWYFNNTLDTVEVEQHRVQVLTGLSYLDYTPRSSRDYGSLSCWATNSVGTQAEPCHFTVIEAGPPDRVENCKLLNHTQGTLEVQCWPGFDGGLPQWFMAKVYDATSHTLLSTLQEATPKFKVMRITGGQDYLITINAINNRGTSEPVHIDAIRLKVAEKRMVEVSEPGVSPLVGVFLGIVGGFVALILLTVSLTLFRSYRSQCLMSGDIEMVGLASPSTPATRSSPNTQHNDTYTASPIPISTNKTPQDGHSQQENLNSATT